MKTKLKLQCHINSIKDIVKGASKPSDSITKKAQHVLTALKTVIKDSISIKHGQLL
jgi:hypothetical protein